MARIKNGEQKEQVGTRVPPEVKVILEQMAEQEERTVSQVVWRILAESPEIKRGLRKNGKGK